MKHIVSISMNPWGDDGSFDPTHIQQMNSIFMQITDTILRFEKIPSFVVMKAENNFLANVCIQILLESELGHLPYTMVPLEFLKSGSDEKPEKIADFLLKRLRSESLIIVISQRSILSRLPKVLLEKTNKDPNKLLKFAINPENFNATRGLSLGFSEECELHSIHQI